MGLRECRARAGFTIIEVLVTLVVLTVVGVSLAGANQYAARILQRSRMELNAARFTETEAERLRLTTYASLATGQRTEGRGIARWTVVDLTTYRQVTLVTVYGSGAIGFVTDSLTIYRLPP